MFECDREVSTVRGPRPTTAVQPPPPQKKNLVEHYILNNNYYILYVDLEPDTKQGEATDDVHTGPSALRPTDHFLC